MTVLLTGGAGFIGSHTALVLLESGVDIVLLDNFSNSSRQVPSKLEQLTGKPVKCVEGDVRDTALVSQLLADHGIQQVIHLAGLKAVGESVSAPLAYYANNVQGAVSLLQAMNSAGVKSLVFSSSATVYGEPQYLPIDEAHATSATNPYGRTKLHIEEMLSDLCSADPGWRVACLRYFNPVGAHPSGTIGENPAGIPNNLMPFVAQVAAGKCPELRVFGDDYPTPDGTGVRDYIHVLDLAEGHRAALDFLARRRGWHAINLGTGKGSSVLQLTSAFEVASGKKIPLQIVARRPGDIATCYASVDKAKADLGWQATRSLETMCTSAWNFQTQAL